MKNHDMQYKVICIRLLKHWAHKNVSQPCQEVTVHGFNPSTRVAEAGGSL